MACRQHLTSELVTRQTDSTSSGLSWLLSEVTAPHSWPSSPSFLPKPPHAPISTGSRWSRRAVGFKLLPPYPLHQDQTPLAPHGGRIRSVRRALCRAASFLFPQLVYMGFDEVAAKAALRVFRDNVQLAAQTLVHNEGRLPPDLQLSAEDSSSTPSTSPSDSAGGSGVWGHQVGAGGWRGCLVGA